MSNILQEVVKEAGGVSQLACKVGRKYPAVASSIRRKKDNLAEITGEGSKLAVELFLINGKPITYTSVENGVLIEIKIEKRQ